MNKRQTKTSNLQKGKRYSSVPEMVRDLSMDKEFASSLEQTMAERNIIDLLMGLRTSKGLSQQDIAAAMGCTQSRISKLENGKDDDLCVGDFHAYTAALGLRLRGAMDGLPAMP